MLLFAGIGIAIFSLFQSRCVCVMNRGESVHRPLMLRCDCSVARNMGDKIAIDGLQLFTQNDL